MLLKYYILSAFVFLTSYHSKDPDITVNTSDTEQIYPGAYAVDQYIDKLSNKKVGLVVNHTSKIGDEHLVDSLLSMDINVKAIFTPEHGFKGAADAGAKVEDGVYKRKIPVYSLYGKTKKPKASVVAGLDVIVFDIQDVGARFYTYLSTMHYILEAAAEVKVPVIILDRPNPNGHRIDGPVLDVDFKSFVGMHPVPIVYGMTIGEYGKMINGEGWLANQIKADLTVIPCANYDHQSQYTLPIAPSPNLPNQRSILLYPSLCLFEGTTVSIGRGTDQQFQVIGHPQLTGKYQFTPKSGPGSKYPKHENEMCYGENLSTKSVLKLYESDKLDLNYLIESYEYLRNQGVPFFNENNFFEKLAGTKRLREQIKKGMTEEEIRATWYEEIYEFKLTRSKYLIY